MYTATFTFAKRHFDDEFHAIDQLIAQVAKSTPGYLAEECWENPSTELVCNVYYWETMSALQELMQHPAHMAAKQRQGEWLDGYHVTIAQVIASCGDGSTIAHPLAQAAPFGDVARIVAHQFVGQMAWSHREGIEWRSSPSNSSRSHGLSLPGAHPSLEPR